MLLILSGAVEHISRLDMTLRDDGMHVEFEGMRHKVYSDAGPTRISVSSVCAIGLKTRYVTRSFRIFANELRTAVDSLKR